MAGQRTVTATLATLAEAVEREGIGAPALIVVGPVVERREALAWLERRPLHGRRVVVTRARAQASGLAATLRGLGAEVIELPAIRIEPRIERDGGARARSTAIGEYALICLTSPNGVRLLFEALRERRTRRPRRSPARPSPRSAPAPRGPWPRTASPPTSSPSASSPRPWSRRWPRSRSSGQRVLVARAADARDVLPERAARARRRGRRRRPLRDRPRGARPRGGRGRSGRRLRHLHLVLDRAQPDRGARRPLPGRRPHRLDRPGDERGRSRSRPRGRRRSRPPRHRRPRRRPARRRRESA